MASNITNERILRKITIATLLPAFPLIVAAGVMSSRAQGWEHCYYYNYGCPQTPTIIFFGLIPTFISVITSVLSLRTTRDPLQKYPAWRTGLWFLIDAFLAAAYLAVLIPIWIFEPRAMNSSADWMMLETYATIPFLSNLFIHAYLAFYQFLKKLPTFFSTTFSRTECPHCHGKITTSEVTGAKREGYSLLRAENYLDEPEGEPSTGAIRLSTDSEA